MTQGSKPTLHVLIGAQSTLAPQWMMIDAIQHWPGGQYRAKPTRRSSGQIIVLGNTALEQDRLRTPDGVLKAIAAGVPITSEEGLVELLHGRSLQDVLTDFEILWNKRLYRHVGNKSPCRGDSPKVRAALEAFIATGGKPKIARGQCLSSLINDTLDHACLEDPWGPGF